MVCHLLPFAKVGQCREDYNTPALFAWDKRALFGNYFDSLSDPLKCIISLLDEPFSLNVGAMDF